MQAASSYHNKQYQYLQKILESFKDEMIFPILF